AQIQLARTQAAAGGHIHFSLSALTQNRQGLADLLSGRAYATPALVPASPWLTAEAAPAPELLADPSANAVQVLFGDEAPVAAIAVWRRHRERWRFAVQAPAERRISLAAHPLLGPVQSLVISLVDRSGTEGPRSALEWAPANAG